MSLAQCYWKSVVYQIEEGRYSRSFISLEKKSCMNSIKDVRVVSIVSILTSPGSFHIALSEHLIFGLS